MIAVLSVSKLSSIKFEERREVDEAIDQNG